MQVRGITRDEITYRIWKKGEREFHIFLDRDYRDCIAYAAIMGFDDPYDVGGAMFELDPMEVIRWHWEEELAA